MATKKTIASVVRPQPKKELELLELELKRIEIEERRRGLEYNQSQRNRCEEDRLNLEKINALNFLLISTVVDSERTLIGSESVHRPVYFGCDEELIRMKVLAIVGRL